MATVYDVGLVKEVAAEKVLGQIKDLVGGEFAGSAELYVLPGLVVSVSPVDHPIKQEVYQETWEMNMQTSVGFLLNYQTEPELRWTAAGLMSIAAAQLVVMLDTDAGMTVSYERKLMHRRDGVLYLYDWWPQWTEPSVRAKLPEPYILTSADPIV
jgi:hypothetical protein